MLNNNERSIPSPLAHQNWWVAIKLIEKFAERKKESHAALVGGKTLKSKGRT